MLYRGSEIMREVGWVIFDEIHYMRDKGTSLVNYQSEFPNTEKTHQKCNASR